MKTAILTDSGCNLEKSFVEANKNLFVVPLNIVINDQTFKDQVDITAEEIYQKIDTHNISTSLPDNSEVEKALESIKKAGFEQVLVINISSGLSGTFNAFRLILQQEETLKITQYDTKTLGAGQGYLVKYALELLEKSTNVDEIVKALDDMRFNDSIAMYTINTLKYLKKGGRIGKVEGTIGELLHIKPVVTVNNEGIYVTLSKAIGLQRSLLSMKEILIKKFQNEQIDLTVHYGNDLEKATQLGQMLEKVLNVRTLEISALTPVLGIHTGPSMFAYVARKVK